MHPDVMADQRDGSGYGRGRFGSCWGYEVNSEDAGEVGGNEVLGHLVD